jgi:membrane protease YdiL (CAAX protease family)
VNRRGSEQAQADPSALFFESLRLVAGLATGVVWVGLLAAWGLDIENNLYAKLSVGPQIVAVAAAIYFITRGESAGPEIGAAPGEKGAWPESPRSWGETVKAVLLATLAIIVGSMLITQIVELLGLSVDEQQSIVDLTKPVDGAINPAVFILAPMAVLAAPLFEELLFRRLYFRRLLAKVGAVPAFVASSIAFAAIHGNPSGVPVYLLQAVIFGGVYRYTGRISAAIAVHFLNNAITLAVLVSGLGS